MVGGPIIAHHAGPIDRYDHRKFLQGDIMNNLIIAALQKSRVNRGKRLSPFLAMPAAKVKACCSAIPTSKKTVRELPGKSAQSGTITHRGRNCHHIGGFSLANFATVRPNTSL